MTTENQSSDSVPLFANNKILAPPPTPPPTANSDPLRISPDRLSLPLGLRIPLCVIIGSFSGFILGLAKGSKDTGLRVQAENAHRLPRTQAGWYLYHKSKNYNMMLGGIVEGMKQSIRIGVWVGAFFLLEDGVDRGRAAGVRLYRRVVVDGEYSKRPRAFNGQSSVEDLILANQVAGNRDCISSMLAGLGTAGIFSAWNRFPIPTAARTAKMGARAGLAFGVLQDLLSVVRGRRVGYVEFFKTGLFGSRNEDASSALEPLNEAPAITTTTKTKT